MTVNRTRKSRKLRGVRQHGYGKTHRGAGNRGGRGRAGTGKKADQKKPSVWGDSYFGKSGFVKSRVKKFNNIISLADLKNTLGSFIQRGFAKEESGILVVDLDKAGYTKLLGNGSFDIKVKILVASASKNAVEKIKAAGGELIIE